MDRDQKSDRSDKGQMKTNQSAPNPGLRVLETRHRFIPNSVMKIDLVTIIIVTWNCKEEIKTCLKSLQEQHDLFPEFETLVVDNASEDGTREYLRAGDPSFIGIGLRVMYNSSNVGLSLATEQAFRIAAGDWILLCNADITFNENVVRLFSYGYSHPDEIVTVEMVNEEGTPPTYVHSFPTVTGVFFGFGLIGSFLDRKLLDRLLKKPTGHSYEDQSSIVSVDSPGASFLFFKRSIVDKLGRIFDTSLPVWWNDVDLAKRAQRAGVRRVLISDLKVKHGLGQGGSNRMPDTTKRRLFCRSMIIYAQKWKLHPRLLQSLFCADAILGVPIYAIARSRSGGFAEALRNSISHAAAQTSGILGS